MFRRKIGFELGQDSGFQVAEMASSHASESRHSPLRPRYGRRYWQLSLRTLFVLLTLAAVWLGVVFKRVREQRAAVARIHELGGYAFYGFEYDDRGRHRPDALLPGRPWLRRLVGPEFLQDVVQVRLDQTAVTDADLRLIGKLRSMTHLHLNSTNISDAGLRVLQHCKRIRYLGLFESKVTGEGLRYLKGMDALDTLVLQRTAVDDGGLEQLRGLKQLSMLNLGGTGITSRGVAQLTELSTLRYLNLSETPVNDSAVGALVSMAGLTELNLQSTMMSGRGLQAVRHALATCNVDCDVIDLAGNKQFTNDVASQTWGRIVARVRALDLERRVKLIDLSKSDAEDNHILALHSLRHVEFIDLRETHVTEGGVEALRSALPDIDVDW